MNHAVVASLFGRVNETPFWVRREGAQEASALLKALGLRPNGQFHAPPLPAAFGPGTAFPQGLQPVRVRARR